MHYVSAIDLLSHLRSGFNGGREPLSEDACERLRRLEAIGVLALDELDKAYQTPWARDQLTDLIDKGKRTLTGGDQGMTPRNVPPTHPTEGGAPDTPVPGRLSSRRIGPAAHLQSRVVEAVETLDICTRKIVAPNLPFRAVDPVYTLAEDSQSACAVSHKRRDNWQGVLLMPLPRLNQRRLEA